MYNTETRRLLRVALTLATASGIAAGTEPVGQGRLSVAVTETDVEAIVRAVGGNQIDTCSLFRGCILRKDLRVEPGVRERLRSADAVVWTGFINESAAMERVTTRRERTKRPAWIDVSRGVTRVNVPLSTCFGYVDAALAPGDPFFWLNPLNGAIIARNVADGLSALRPEQRGFFLANADAFSKALDKDIARWKEDLKRLVHVRVFSTQCGWQNFARLGGPAWVVYKRTPGSLPEPRVLLDQVTQMKAEIVIVDPNTAPPYLAVFRERYGARAIEVPSSIETVPGATSYNSLFENLARRLVKTAEALKRSAKN